MQDNKSKTILLVEDEAIVALAETGILERNGYCVIAVGSGEEAVETVKTRPDIDLILMDIDLGKGMTGTEAAERILDVRDVPVVFLSSHTEREVVEKTEGITSYGYIYKDSGETIMIASIRMAFRLFEAKQSEGRKEEALRRAGRELERYFMSSLDLFCIADASGRFLRLNPEWEAVLGYPPAELEGRTLIDFVHQEDRGAVDTAISALTDQNGAISFEARCRHRDGSYRWIEWRSRPEGGLVYAAARDVTERKLAENALRESEERFRRLANDIPAMICEFLPDSTLTFVNRTYCEYFGEPPEKLIGRPFLSFLPEEAQAAARAQFTSLTPRRPAVRYVHEVIRNGEVRWQEWSDRAVFDDAGSVVKYQSIGTDVTERVQAEEALLCSEERWKFALDGAGHGVWDVDVANNRMFVSVRGKEVFGFGEGLIHNAFQEFEKRIHPQDREAVLRDFREHIYGDMQTCEREYRLRRDDGTYRWVLDRGKVISRTASGSPLRVVGTVTDITERKLAGDRIRSLLREKELLLKESHHRIKNNFDVIKSLLWLQAQTNESCAGILEDASSRVHSMMVLYDRLSRSAAFDELNIREYLPQLIEEIVAQFRPACNIRIDTSIDDIAISVNVLSPIGIMLNEMITNSVKHAFGDNDSAVITVAASRNENVVSLVYSDNGRGLPQSATLKNASSLGLQLIRLLAEQIDGTIAVAAEGGTTYTVQFHL